MEPCPCGSGQAYADCCQPLIAGQKAAPTAEALMRARYSAFVKAEIDFICNTVPADQQKSLNREEISDWSKKSEWQGLEIVETVDGGLEDQTGTVEFIARFREKEKMREHHELATFSKIDGNWFFMDGQAPKPKQVVRTGPKTGRNAPCPCGSGKKYKKCCGG